jgi:hypothetical protein
VVDGGFGVRGEGFSFRQGGGTQGRGRADRWAAGPGREWRDGFGSGGVSGKEAAPDSRMWSCGGVALKIPAYGKPAVQV